MLSRRQLFLLLSSSTFHRPGYNTRLLDHVLFFSYLVPTGAVMVSRLWLFMVLFADS